jgi:hypothetical protein
MLMAITGWVREPCETKGADKPTEGRGVGGYERSGADAGLANALVEGDADGLGLGEVAEKGADE